MSVFRSVCVASGSVLALGFAVGAAAGQEEKAPSRKAEAAGPIVRQVYAVRGGSPKELANTLILHFKSEPTFLAVPSVGTNTLLLSGPEAVLRDAVAALREIDRPARTVHVEVLLLELAAKPGEAGGEGKAAEGVSLLAGPTQEVLARVRDLQQRGVITNLKHLHLTGVEGQTSKAQVMEDKPYVVGSTGGVGRGGFPGSQTISYRHLGTLVQVSPQITADGRVELALHVEDSQMRTPDGGAAAGADERGVSVPTAEFVTYTFESPLAVRPGQMIVAQGTRANSRAGQAQTVVLVSAGADEGTPRPGK